MRRVQFTFIVSFLSIMFVFSIYPDLLSCSAWAKGESEYQNALLEARRTDILKKASEKEKDELLIKLDEIETRVSRYDSENKTLEFSINGTSKEIFQLKLDASHASLDLKRKFLQFKTRIRNIYKRRSISVVETIFSGKDLNNCLNRMNYLLKLARHDQEAFAELRELIKGMDTRSASLKRKKDFLEKLLKQQSSTTLELKQVLLEKQKFLPKIKHRIEVLKARSDRQRSIALKMKKTVVTAVKTSTLVAENNTIAPVRTDGPGYSEPTSDDATPLVVPDAESPSVNQKGVSNLAWPAGNIEKVVELWGESVDKLTGTKKVNSGIKIALAEGTPIKAAGDGIVVYKGRMEGYGLFVILNHGDDLTTVYASLEEAMVRVGKLVTQDEKIAISGEKSFHFEVRKNSITQNPLNWLM